MGKGKVTGVVIAVTEPKVFERRNATNNRVMRMDYYHVLLRIKKNKNVKVYFPVNANVSHSPSYIRRGGRKVLDGGKGFYSRNKFVKILNENTGEWIDYQIANPKKLTGYTVEVTGDVKKNDDGNYYMNRIEEFKVHGKDNG